MNVRNGPSSSLQQISLWIVVVAFALAVPAGSIIIPLGKEPRSPSKVCERTYAVCVVGAVRSMDYAEVRNSFENNVVGPLGGCGDIFHYLFVGDELSDRGQRKLNKSRSKSMVKALTHSTQVALQYAENGFSCGQQTTGRYHKMAECARMVRRYEYQHHIAYDIFILTRPDVKYLGPVPMFSTQPFDLFRNMGPGWFKTYAEGDLYAMSGRSGIRAVENAAAAKCCDVKSRRPAQCFIDGLKEPRSNFIFHRHLRARLREIRKDGGFGITLVRTPDMFHNGRSSEGDEHGRYRLDVERMDHPSTVEALHWRSMDRHQRLTWMKAKLDA